MENQTNQQNSGQGFAIASLVIGIFSFLFAIIPCVGTLAILFGIIAIVFGSIALTRATDKNQSKGMGIAGISLGGVAIFIAILMTALIFNSKNLFKDKFKEHFEWAKEFEDIDENFEDMESLEDLEKALDELEGAVDEINKEVNKSAVEIQAEVKKALEDAKKDIDDAKLKQKPKTENE